MKIIAMLLIVSILSFDFDSINNIYLCDSEKYFQDNESNLGELINVQTNANVTIYTYINEEYNLRTSSKTITLNYSTYIDQVKCYTMTHKINYTYAIPNGSTEMEFIC